MKGCTDLSSVFWQTVYPMVHFATRNRSGNWQILDNNSTKGKAVPVTGHEGP
jgi:hypothetical protein